MEATRYRIGEVCKITGLSKDTIHFYVKSGLLTPDFVDENNGYRYYSRWNLWQLDVITMCRKLSIPLSQVKEILASHDNAKVTELLAKYRDQALALSRYYQQVAEDISWYETVNEQIQSQPLDDTVHLEVLDSQVVIAGLRQEKQAYEHYHASLMEAAKDELLHAESIRRKYGYVLELEAMKENRIFKLQEYMQLENSDYSRVHPENLMVMPAGEYAIFSVHIQDEQADFSPLFNWLEANKRTVDLVFADEIGLQLFGYVEYGYDCTIKAHLVDDPKQS